MGLEGAIMAIKRTLLGGGLNALRSLENIARVDPEEVAQLTAFLEKKGIKAPISQPAPQRLSNRIQDSLGVSEQELQPQGFAERLAQGLISVAPFAAGGKPGRLVAGQATKAVLGEAGAPDWLQTAGQLATEGAITKRQLKKSGKVSDMSDHTSNTYQQARESLKKNEKGSAKAIQPFLEKIDQLWKKETDNDVRQMAEGIANTISSNIDKNGNIDILNAWENKQALSQQYKYAKGAERRYIEEARKGLDKVLKEHSPANPNFSRKMSEADRLTTYKYNNGKIKEFLDDLHLSKITKLFGLPQALDAMEKVGKAAVNPAVLKYYTGLTKAVIEDNKQSAIRYATAINNAWNKTEPENEGWVEVPEDAGWVEVV